MWLIITSIMLSAITIMLLSGSIKEQERFEEQWKKDIEEIKEMIEKIKNQ